MTEKKTLYDIFTEEAAEIISMLEHDLLELETDIENKGLIDSIFRYVHTLKGSSGMVDYSLLTTFAHELENILTRIRSGSLKVTPGLINLFLSAVDLLKQFLVCNPSNAEENIGLEVRSLVDNIGKFKGLNTHEAEPEKKEPSKTKDTFDEKILQISMKFRPDIYETGTDPLMLLRELDEVSEIIRIKSNTEAVPNLERLQYERLYLSWEILLKTDKPLSTIENIFIFVNEDNTVVIENVSDKFIGDVDTRYADKMLGEILEEEGYVTESELLEIIDNQKKVGQILVDSKSIDTGVVDRVLESQKKSRDLQISSTIRVDTSKLDKLVNIVGELVISIARMNQLVSEQGYKNRDLYDASEQLERISRYVQEQVMKVRMVPIEGTFRRFQRVVRDTARELDKRINLFMTGSDTELDKTLIEQIEDPLKHLIRNAVDHGVGSPDERIAAGKPVEGSIWLRAYQQEGKIIIEVEDDGKGIDKKVILRKAGEKGLYKGGELSNKEIYNFLFLPGFSTAKQVSEISGRGVGLDVVRKNIESLRGSIDVFSQKGKGTLFRLKLPLTLAIIEGMQVSVGEEIITVPLFSIVEAVRPEDNIVKTIEGKGELMEFRGGYIPLLRLYEVFDFETEVKDPENALILILEGHNRKIGLMVDDVTGQQQVVIKSLERNYKQVPGISGATVLGGGKISLILDVYGLEKLAFGEMA
jgi:two-component system, chemotaxis family, sensor kinase CheA